MKPNPNSAWEDHISSSSKKQLGGENPKHIQQEAKILCPNNWESINTLLRS